MVYSCTSCQKKKSCRWCKRGNLGFSVWPPFSCPPPYNKFTQNRETTASPELRRLFRIARCGYVTDHPITPLSAVLALALLHIGDLHEKSFKVVWDGNAVAVLAPAGCNWVSLDEIILLKNTLLRPCIEPTLNPEIWVSVGPAGWLYDKVREAQNSLEFFLDNCSLLFDGIFRLLWLSLVA